MNREEFEGVVLREKERKLSISRLPRQTKEEFVKFAEDEFCNDFGMALKAVWDNFKLWKMFFENVDFKLDYIISRVENQKEEKPESDIKLLSGRIVKGGKKKDNGQI